MESKFHCIYSVVKSNQGNSSCHARLNPFSWCLAEAKIESNSSATLALLTTATTASKEGEQVLVWYCATKNITTQLCKQGYMSWPVVLASPEMAHHSTLGNTSVQTLAKTTVAK